MPLAEPTQAFVAGEIDGAASSVDQAGVDGGNPRRLFRNCVDIRKSLSLVGALPGKSAAKEECSRMAGGHLEPVLRQLHRLFARETTGTTADGLLLEQFARGGDQAAFAELVRRHGPMVLRVCNHVLHDPHGADDAFQATFLVLARRAAAIRRKDSVASWLHGVAYRVAMRARAAAALRRTRESQAPARQANPDGETDMGDLRQVLHQELDRLPDKYRAPLVLCYLEGKSHREAADELGWPPGSLAKRLAIAQERLRHRLAGRGIALSTAALLTALAAGEAPAAVSAALVDSTTRAAAAFAAGSTGPVSATAIGLAHGVLRMQFLAKLKIAMLATLVLVAAASGIGVVALRPGIGAALPPPQDDAAILTPLVPPDPPLPPAAEPVVKDGLSVAIRPSRATFAIGAEPVFVVTFKNVSEKAIHLGHPGDADWRFAFNAGKPGDDWLAIPIPHKDSRLALPPVELKPGASFEYRTRMDVRYQHGDEAKTEAFLPEGKYTARATVRFRDSAKAPPPLLWDGVVETKPVALAIADHPVIEAEARAIAIDLIWYSLNQKPRPDRDGDGVRAVKRINDGKVWEVEFFPFEGNSMRGLKTLIDAKTGKFLENRNVP